MERYILPVGQKLLQNGSQGTEKEVKVDKRRNGKTFLQKKMNQTGLKIEKEKSVEI